MNIKNKNNPRRQFLNRVLSCSAVAATGLWTWPTKAFSNKKHKQFQLSLSQWALHRAIFANTKDNYREWQRLLREDPDRLWQGNLHPLDFPAKARRDFGLDAVEYVNTCFYGHARDNTFLHELKMRTEGEGVKNLLIMVDEEGQIGDPDSKRRTTAIENHFKWIEAAAYLGCHSIRANAHSQGNYETQKTLTAEGLFRLAEYADQYKLDILIENHGGMSSHPDWLLETIAKADHPRLGTMVDFDNFAFSETQIWGGKQRFDRYEGVTKLMPHAKSVSAKSYAFDESGFETTIDYERMTKIVLEAGYEGYVSIEYEGHHLGENEGIKATKALLEKMREKLSKKNNTSGTRKG